MGLTVTAGKAKDFMESQQSRRKKEQVVGREEKNRWVRGKFEETKKMCSEHAGGGCGLRGACQDPAEQKVNDIKAKTLDIFIPCSSCSSEESEDV